MSSSVPQGPPGALQTRALEQSEGAPRLGLLASLPPLPHGSAACLRGAGASRARLPSKRRPSKAGAAWGPAGGRASPRFQASGFGWSGNQRDWTAATRKSRSPADPREARGGLLFPQTREYAFCPHPEVEFLNFQCSLFRLLVHTGLDKHRNGSRSLSGDLEPGDQGDDI